MRLETRVKRAKYLHTLPNSRLWLEVRRERDFFPAFIAAMLYQIEPAKRWAVNSALYLVHALEDIQELEEKGQLACFLSIYLPFPLRASLSWSLVGAKPMAS